MGNIETRVTINCQLVIITYAKQWSIISTRYIQDGFIYIQLGYKPIFIAPRDHGDHMIYYHMKYTF